MKIFVVDKWKAIRYAFALIIIGFVFTLAGRMSMNIIATVILVYYWMKQLRKLKLTNYHFSDTI